MNERILDALKKPSEGPPMTLMPVDAETVVAAWLEARGQRLDELPEAVEPQRRKRSRLRRLFVERLGSADKSDTI